ncbi:MAG: type II secretion system protein [Patescibacteria group bacterium]|nr:type II secretion system GspH family protein [Patescibacteria group bacterium]
MGKNLGQTLIESLFAISISALILAGLVFGVIFFSRASRSAKDRSLAVKMVQEKMEYLRSMKKNNPIGFWTDAAAGAVITEDAGLGNPADYRREIVFSGYRDDFANTRRVKVKVTVSWNDAGETRSVDATTYFTEL